MGRILPVPTLSGLGIAPRQTPIWQWIRVTRTTYLVGQRHVCLSPPFGAGSLEPRSLTRSAISRSLIRSVPTLPLFYPGLRVLEWVNCGVFRAPKRAKTSRGAGFVLHSTRPPAVEGSLDLQCLEFAI